MDRGRAVAWGFAFVVLLVWAAGELRAVFDPGFIPEPGPQAALIGVVGMLTALGVISARKNGNGNGGRDRAH